jgi:hypothetical protein
MATGWPMKTTYADGDVYAASDVNDITGTINLLGSSVAYAAGKNKIINGDFYVNQRAFTTNTTNGTFTFDRFRAGFSGDGTSTYTAETFTLGTAPVSGYEGKNYLQIATAGVSSTSSFTLIQQKIESVRTLAGQTATISFWAKATTGTPKILAYVQQQFGTGGSPSSAVSTYAPATAITTSWVRYSFPITIPSISGKTLGTSNNDFLTLSILISAGSDNGAPFTDVGIQNNTFQFWGIQLEAGSTATAFQTATGTIQGELAACQRYYFRYSAQSAPNGSGVYYTSTLAVVFVKFPTTMRATPTYGSSGVDAFTVTSTAARNTTANSLDVAAPDGFMLLLTTAASTIGYGAVSYLNSASKYVEASAEL